MCSTPNQNKSRLEKTKDLQWSSSPVEKSERTEVLSQVSDVDALRSEVLTEVTMRNASVDKRVLHQQSSRKMIEFDVESSESSYDKIMQPTSARKRKVPTRWQTTELKKPTRVVVDETKERGNVIIENSTIFTKKDVDTFQTFTIEDSCNSYFELESSDEEFLITPKKGIKKNTRQPRTHKISGKLNHSKVNQKGKCQPKSLVIKHVGARTPEKEIKKPAQSNTSQPSCLKTRLEKYTEEPGNLDEILPLRSICRKRKKNLETTSPRRLKVQKRISFALTKENESMQNSEAPESKVLTGMRKSSRPRAACTAFWLGEKASYNANNCTLTTATNLSSNNLLKSERVPLKKCAQPDKKVLESRQGHRTAGNKKPVLSVKKKKKGPSPDVTERGCVLGVRLEDVEFCVAEDDDPNGALYATSLNTYNMEAGYIKLSAGTRTGKLISADHNKLYTVLENAVSLNIDGVQREICPFGQFHVDKGVVHEIINESNSSASLLQYIVIY